MQHPTKTKEIVMLDWLGKLQNVAMVVLVLSAFGCADGSTPSHSVSSAGADVNVVPNRRVKPDVTYDRVSTGYIFSTAGTYQERVVCPLNDHLASGGFETTAGANNIKVTGSFPVSGAAEWEVDVMVTGSGGMVVYGICSQ
jgi:hypothetical protein